jgi:hypothetical protein
VKRPIHSQGQKTNLVKGTEVWGGGEKERRKESRKIALECSRSSIPESNHPYILEDYPSVTQEFNSSFTYFSFLSFFLSFLPYWILCFDEEGVAVGVMGNGGSARFYQERIKELYENTELVKDKKTSREEKEKENEEEFWSTFWSVPSSAKEVFSLIRPDDVLGLRRRNPTNLHLFIEKIIRHITDFIHHYSSSSYSPSSSSSSLYTPTAVLNCVRILSRILPVLYSDEPSRDYVETVFWHVPELQGNPLPFSHSLTTRLFPSYSPSSYNELSLSLSLSVTLGTKNTEEAKSCWR